MSTRRAFILGALLGLLAAATMERMIAIWRPRAESPPVAAFCEAVTVRRQTGAIVCGANGVETTVAYVAVPLMVTEKEREP